MDLEIFIDRFIDCLKHLDNTDNTPRFPRTRPGATPKPPYLPGIHTIPERETTTLAAEIWRSKYPADFGSDGYLRSEVPYPYNSRQKCDFVMRTKDYEGPNAEWAIEVKKLAFIGDNGKNNDHAVQKLLSPYLKDRSLIHDIDRLQNSGLAARKAVVGYSFSYSYETCDEAEHRHPDQLGRIWEIRKVCSHNDPNYGVLDPMDMVEWADQQFRRAKKVSHPVIAKKERGLWRHPCGGTLVVFGWELP